MFYPEAVRSSWEVRNEIVESSLDRWAKQLGLFTTDTRQW